MNLIQLPDEAIERARQLAGDIDANEWELGDLITDLVAEARPYGGTIQSVCATLAYNIPLEATTLVDYEYVARKVPAKQRHAFETLSRHQWKACLGAGEAFVEAAAWATEVYPLTNAGRVAPVRAIWAYVLGGEVEVDEHQLVQRYEQRLMRVLMDGAHDERAPSWMAQLFTRMATDWAVERGLLNSQSPSSRSPR